MCLLNVLSGFHSEDESEDRTPLSKKEENVQTKDIVLLKKNPIIDIPESPEQKKRPAEDQEPSSSKKRKVTRKSETAALKLRSEERRVGKECRL